MNLQQLECFREIARTQNITKSAERLRVSQPALSRTLKALEEELGITLFDRKGRSLALNQSGQEFLISVNSIFDILDRNWQRTQIAQDAPYTEIVIGGMVSEIELLPLIYEFSQAHPYVYFRINSRKIVNSQNTEDTTDFLLSANRMDHQGREMLEVFYSKPMVVLSETDPLAKQESVALAQLSHHRFAFCTPPSGVMPRAYNLCVAAGFRPKVVFTSDERYPICIMLLQGGCVSIQPEADARLLAGLNCGLAALPIDDVLPEYNSRIFISWKSQDKLSSAARNFLQFVIAKTNEGRFG